MSYTTIASNISGLLGTILIFQFGIPNQIDTGGKQGFMLMEENEQEKIKIKRYRLWSKVGLVLIGISFLLPLIF